MKKSSIIEEIKDRLGLLEKEQSSGKKKVSKPKADEEVCLVCGGDLLFVEEGIVYCPRCKEYYENDVEEEEEK